MTYKIEEKASSMELTRLKAASEEYKVHKSILIDPVTEERLTGFQEWPVFRDEFLTDWKSNRRVYTAKEADMIFEKLANESLSELDRTGASDVGTESSEGTTEIPSEVKEIVHEVSQAAVQAVLEAAVKAVAAPTPAPKRYGRGRGRPPGRPPTVKDESTAPKRRGRPPGSGKKATASKPAMKRVAAKKKGGNATARAEAIVKKYRARDWPRKDIIQKLIVAGISSGYAPSVYQKFAGAR